MKKVLLVSLSMLVILPSIRFVANPLYAQQLIMGGQYDHPRDEGHVSRMPLPPKYITQEEHKIESGVRYAGNMIEVMDDDMVLFITTIDANGCVNIPAKIIGTMYQELAEEENNVLFGGRLAEYKYYNMDEVIKKANSAPLT